MVLDSESIPWDNIKHLIIEVYLWLSGRERRVRHNSVQCQMVCGFLAHEKRDPRVALDLQAS